MGLLRTLFALAVVFAHSPFNQGDMLIGGRLAVQLFYVISGFLISYILTTNEVYRCNVWRFYQNRALRLFPCYAAIALVTLVLNTIVNPEFFEVYRHSPLPANLFLILSNLFIFGQDWVMFAGIKSGVFMFTGNFTHSDVLLYKGLLAPQAWTLGVELSFYLIAPFILRSMRCIVVLFLASLCLRTLLLYLGLAQSDPWSYRFFPLELALFLAGALSHRLLMPSWRRCVQRCHYLPEIVTAMFAGYSLIHSSIGLNHNLRDAIALAVFIAILPLTFIYQGRHKWDKKIGQLSYPIYICHWMALSIVYQAAAQLGITDELTITSLNIILTLTIAPVLWWTIDNRIDKIRERIKTIPTVPSYSPAGAMRA